MGELWRIELLGNFRVQGLGREITRFRTQKTAALLAYLAYHLNRKHPREVLTELLWPDFDLDAGRNSLTTSLSSLRRQLEPPGIPAGGVIVADRFNVGLSPVAVRTDVAEFEECARQAINARDELERLQLLTDAVKAYGGELLPGYYDGWILQEQHRLSELFLQTIRQLIASLKDSGDLQSSVLYAHRAVAVDPLSESAHEELMRLYVATGQPAAALEQYEELKRLLENEFGDSPAARPSERLIELAQDVASSGQQKRSVRSGRRKVKTVAAPVVPTTVKDTHTARLPTKGMAVVRLPLRLTRFFGREHDMRRLREMLISHDERMVTLTGPGGSGKTRLALEVAQQVTSEMPGGVWFVPLADLSDAHYLLDAIMDVLQMQRTGDLDPLDQIAHEINGHRALLVLDNFEHIVPDGAMQVRALLERSDSLHCLVTSRRRLNLSGEREFVVMPLPRPTGSLDPEELMQCDSVHLFVDRAQGVRPDFQVTPANAMALMDICTRLEGIPLALELVAARAQLLSPSRMAEHLTERLDFFASRQRDVPARHRTMRAAIDWGYQLLPPEVQRFFAALSVFRGGWILDAACAITGETSGLEYLHQLRDCSMLTVHEHEGVVRFQLLDTLREYARDQLVDDDCVWLEQRHAEYFLRFAEQQSSNPQEMTHPARLAEFEEELDNLRAAMEWASVEEEHEFCARLASACYEPLHRRGRWIECESMLNQGLDAAQLLGESMRSLEAVIRRHLASLAEDMGNIEPAREHAAASLAICEELKDPTGIAHALNLLGLIAMDGGNLIHAQQQLERALSTVVDGENYNLQGIILHNLGLIASRNGETEKARSLYGSALPKRRAATDRRGEAETLGNLGVLAQLSGNLLEASSIYRDALEIHRSLGYPYGIAMMLNNLGEIAELQNNVEDALLLFVHALKILQDLRSADESVPRQSLSRLSTELGEIQFNKMIKESESKTWEEILAIR